VSSDQWDPAQVVRVRMRFESGAEAWSRRLTRAEAEKDLASASWLACPTWKGKRVTSAAIVVWTHA
jgi:hypothetical protein